MNLGIDWDPLRRFYTRAGIGEMMVGLMNGPEPNRILDLASGTGTLSSAARRQWDGFDLVTVDLDNDVRTYFAPGRGPHRHFVADALDENLPSMIPGGTSGFDVTLCNPPYHLPTWRPGFERILGEAGLLQAFSTRHETTAEAIFIAQNLRLTREGGRIGLIVPDGLITGNRTIEFRSAILRDHRVECVVQLPEGVFSGTRARAFILVLSKGLKARLFVSLRQVDQSGNLSDPILVTSSQGEERLDYAFHAVSFYGLHRSLADLGAHIVRGTLESNEIRGVPFSVFHTTDFPEGPERLAHALPRGMDFIPERKLVAAEPGDILVARVHRSLQRKVCGISRGRAFLTTSVHRIRVNSISRDAALCALLSPEGESHLAATARGVGARTISKHSLLNMRLLP